VTRVRIVSEQGVKYPKLCLYCEFFDGGGGSKVKSSRETGKLLHGDCLNFKSPRFETTSAKTCSVFFLDSCLQIPGRNE